MKDSDFNGFSNNEAVGVASSKLQMDSRTAFDVVNRLQTTGVGCHIDLPLIAVIGSQSAGKSSLIESISGITLPRAAGTCTRCPTVCRLSRSRGEWKCVTKLHFSTDARGQPIPVRNVAFGPVITNKAEVEDRIRRAQLAILNPSHEDTATFLSIDIDDYENEVDFSPNHVSLEISAPDVADLSFVDLPGLIQTTSSRGRDSDIQLVESLVTSYISKPNCLILLTVTCEVDFQTQGTHRLAKLHDPHGERTIGVLTKPDRIPSGDEDLWLRLIRNEDESLVNSWYCVKQPSSSELKKGITWSEARRSEDMFFQTTQPWAQLEVVLQRQLRTSNLVDQLSNLLSELISEKLPEIRHQILSAIHDVELKIEKLPKKPSGDPFPEVLTLVHSFVDDVTRNLEGISREGTLLQRIRAHHPPFRSAILNTVPNFVPHEKGSGKRDVPTPTFLDHEDLNGNALDSSLSDGGDNELIYLDDVLARAQSARTRELPDNYPFVVQQALIDDFVHCWPSPANALMEQVHTCVTEAMNEIVRTNFGKYGQGSLERKVRGIVQQHIKDCLGKCQKQLGWLVEVEKRAFTLNEHYLATYKAKFLAQYKLERQKAINPEFFDAINASSSSEQTVTILSSFAEIGLSHLGKEDLANVLPPDKMEPILEIMASTRAYFQVAYKRFVDNAPLAIDRELVLGLKENLLQLLLAQLGLASSSAQNICQEFAMEDPRIATVRSDLGEKLQRLELASNELLDIGF